MVLTVGRLIRFGDGDGAVIFLSGPGLGLFDRGGGISEIGWRDLSKSPAAARLVDVTLPFTSSQPQLTQRMRLLQIIFIC